MQVKIDSAHAREVLDSRGFPTVEVELTSGKHRARAIVPSGASTGQHEACELRDGDPRRYMGKGVQKAVDSVNSIIAAKLVGQDAFAQRNIDRALLEIDGSVNKTNLGANSLLAVSMAACRLSAISTGQHLYEHLFSLSSNDKLSLPVPFMNILNGGMHADNTLDIQEFMIVPHGFRSFKEALQAGAEVFHHLKNILKKANLSTAVGDEGGFAPNLEKNEQALDLILQAVEKSGYIIGQQISLALDVAASSFFKSEKYILKSGEVLTSKEVQSWMQSMSERYPIISIEDPLDENDWNGFGELTENVGKKIQVVGDDLFVTNSTRLQDGINKKSANAILIKLNQIGTVTETLDTISLAQKHEYGVMVSHRSGETEDTFIADFAVATNAGQIKTGSLSRTDRICKYNQLLRLEETLVSKAGYAKLKKK